MSTTPDPGHPDARRPHEWKPATYAANAGFVPALARDLIADLRIERGQRVLDLGCGDGVLTAAIAEQGAIVVGVDASEAMANAARARGLTVHVMAAEQLTFDAPFDAVFSNAMLHWTRDIDAVLAGVHRALGPGGRFVGEFGGAGNNAAILHATRETLAERGFPMPDAPWYFPASDAFRAALERHGFDVEAIRLFPRPTPLPTDIIGWLETFDGPLLGHLPAAERASIRVAIQSRLAGTHRQPDGTWFVDYVRLRFVAVRRHTGLT